MADIISFDRARHGAKLISQEPDTAARLGDVGTRSRLGKEARHVWWLVSELRQAEAAGDLEQQRDTIEALEVEVELATQAGVRRLAARALRAALVDGKAQQQRPKRRARRRA